MMALVVASLAYGQRFPSAEPRPTVEMGAGFSRERLDWSIAGTPDGKEPNILSELVWEDLHGVNTWLRAETPIWRHVVLAADFSLTHTLSGRARDTDYAGDNRTAKVFDMRFTSDRGYHLAYGAMAGYRMLAGHRFVPAIYLGYRQRAQRLLLLDDTNLKSTYRTKWHGPLVQLCVTYGHRHWAYRAAVSYEQLHYGAVADWNLIGAFAHPKSFEHKAKGYALGLAGQVWLFPYQRVRPSLFFDYRLARSGRGIDYLYLANGEIRLTQFNGIRGSTLSIGAALTYGW